MTNKIKQVDFSGLIYDLISMGWSERAIANRAGVTQPAISQLKSGKSKRPLYPVGVELVRLHKEEIAALDKRRDRTPVDDEPESVGKK